MNGYSEVLQVMGALLLFSLIAFSSNRHIVSNIEKMVGSEVENRAVTIAQDYVEYSKALFFDEATKDGKPDDVSGDFAYPIPATDAQSLSEMTTLNDFNQFSDVISGDLSEFSVSTVVEYVDGPDFSQVSYEQTTHKRLTVEVHEESLHYPITIEYIRSYY